MNYNVEEVIEEVEYYNVYVLCFWLASWFLVLAFSKFAAWKARHTGSDVWAGRTLLTCYEWAVMFQKCSLLVLILMHGFLPVGFFFHPSKEHKDTSTGLAPYIVLRAFCITLYESTSLLVLYPLWSRSAGTVTMRRAIFMMLTATCVVTFIHYLAYSGMINGYTRQWNQTDSDQWFGFPDDSMFVEITPGMSMVRRYNCATVAVIFWAFIFYSFVGIIMLINAFAHTFQPRQPRLFTVLYAMFLSIFCLSYFSYFVEVWTLLHVNPIIILVLCEGPIKLWIMIEDSKYWSHLTINQENSLASLDELDDAFTSYVAFEMLEQCTKLPALGSTAGRCRHIHWTSIVFGELLSKGTSGAVFAAAVNGKECAVKQMRCDVLDEQRMIEVTNEVAISWQLSKACPRPLIVRCDGFSLNPPNIYVVMELCTRGCLMDVLKANQLRHLQRLELAHDAMCAVAHMHKCGFVHRDLKSLNFFVTEGQNGPTDSLFSLRLGDFGETVAVSAAALEQPQQWGSLKWMAPEIIENWKITAGLTPIGGSVYATSADVFSATMVVWECLTGQEPYADERDSFSRKALSPVKLMDAVVGGLRPSTAGIPDGRGGVSQRLQALVECGWHQDPTLRHTAEHISTCLAEEVEQQLMLERLEGNTEESAITEDKWNEAECNSLIKGHTTRHMYS